MENVSQPALPSKKGVWQNLSGLTAIIGLAEGKNHFP